jgi:hypothetical protein
MSSAIPGAPIGPDIEPSSRQKSYDHIPRLRELLPNGGWPGVTYAQVCIHNLKAASDRTERPANLRPIRGSSYYTIMGPNGTASMALVGCGQPIPGAAPEGGERLFFTDGEVASTGHAVPVPIWFSAKPEPRFEPGDSNSDRSTVMPYLTQETSWEIAPGAAAVAQKAMEQEPPRQKRKYTKRKHQPVIHRRGTKRNKLGHYTDSEDTRGTQRSEPQSQAAENQGGEGHARVEGRDPALGQQPWTEGE